MHHIDTLIIGCGYLGHHLLDAQSNSRTVAITRTVTRHPELHRLGARAIAVDITSGMTPELNACLSGFAGTVYVLLPPSSLPASNAAVAIEALLGVLETMPVRRGILASSSAVYGECDGGIVTAATPTGSIDGRGARLLSVEQAWLAAKFDTYVVRLAGLYGPGRIIGRNALLAGETLPGSGEEWLNLVHIEDAARALRATVAVAQPERIALVSDGLPVRRRDYYTALASLLGCAAPVFSEAGTRATGSRRCDPASTWQQLLCQPIHPDFRQAISSAL